MTRRLLLLNLLLVALTALSAWQLRKEWEAARAREAATLGRAIQPLPAPPAAAPQASAPLTPSSYLEIAQKLLFSKDRNPVVVVETPAPPPPKPMPPLPVFHGAMNLGEGPIAIISETPKNPHREFRPGEQVGPFKLVAVTSREILLEWEGKQVIKGIELLAVSSEEPQQTMQRTEAPGPAAPPPPKIEAGPGGEIGRGMRACVPNDSTAPGTVVDGVRKVVSNSPFGQVCRWVPVQ
ncbi:MAG TPA: hypothetical protein VN442_06485 [Bryobacteraceae bacterium]|nr:hypothetical protein [Bryobacteraceae bacterium]